MAATVAARDVNKTCCIRTVVQCNCCQYVKMLLMLKAVSHQCAFVVPAHVAPRWRRAKVPPAS
jgi:hypothetical protein